MSNLHKIFGAEMSPYAVKVRSYARYKGLPHQWFNRGGDNAAVKDRSALDPLLEAANVKAGPAA